MKSPVEMEQLKQGLIQDVAQAEGQAKKTSAAIGIDDTSAFAPRALRMSNRKLGEKELTSFNKALSKAVDDLTFEAGMLDEEQQSVFKSTLKQKYHQIKMISLRSAGELKFYMAKKGVDEKQRQAMLAGLVNAVSGVAQLGMTSVSNKKTEPAKTPTSAESTGMSGMGGGTLYG